MAHGNNRGWFYESKFGMFIHWGLYAVPGGLWHGREMDYIGEWIQAKFRIPNSEYEKLAEQFNPVGFDAEEWVSTARAAGMRYLVYTAKHHEGFAMYHSKVSPFNIVDATPFGRDPLAELAVACRKYGIKLGIYYSQDLDWHEPDGGDPGPEFPKNFGMSWGNDWDFPEYSRKDFNRYFEEKAMPQLTELLTNYGPLGLIWFDCAVSITKEQSVRITAMVKQLQPECLMNTRLGNGFGDIGSLGDNELPSARREGLWESPLTMNDTWGFKINDSNWKYAPQLIENLVGLVSKDTNCLLNVGPKPDGRFPEPAVKILEEIGVWMKRNSAALHACSGNPFPYDFEWGYMTVGRSNGCTVLNLFLREPVASDFVLEGLHDRVLHCYEPGQPDTELPFEQRRKLHIDLRTVTGQNTLTAVVVVLDTDAAPSIDKRLLAQNGRLCLKPCMGKLQHDESQLATTALGVDTAGETRSSANHSKLAPNGSLVDWHNPGDGITWEFVLSEPGHYRIEIVTTARVHSSPWSDGQRIRIDCGDGNWESQLRGHVVAKGCYEQGMSAAGILRVHEPGVQSLTLSMTALGNPKNVNMALDEVWLTKSR
ncbi:MAG: alpha-L-fucosidase [Candidatus Pacebacteria bacterium]|nr:alpha-L-fucosidase [Candidatus Paceibacterota bacterium]